jgi:ABC-2 type transport system ATP-binding protein
VSAIVEVESLVRRFRNLQAVDDLSFRIEEGSVVGFVGANGAGKTTTMRIMATLDMPSAGNVRICGLDVANYPTEVRRLIGWMPDAYGAYENMTVLDYLDFFARAFGYRGAERRSRIDEVMAFVDLAPLAQRDMTELSKGMKQRLCLGRTLLNDPRVLILDEPAAGLDPRARVDFIRLVRLLAQDGKTIFISSHILSELGQMCDSLLFIDGGRLVHQGSADSLVRHEGDRMLVNVQVFGDPATVRDWALLNPGVELYEETLKGARLLFDDFTPEDLSRHLGKMIGDGVPVAEFHQEKISLEDAFVRMLSRAVPPPLPPEVAP